MWTELLKEDIGYVVSRMPGDVVKRLKDEPKRLFLGGGFIRATLAAETPSDIDLFAGSKVLLQGHAQDLKNGRDGRLVTTANALTVLAPPRLPVQFITRWLYDDPEQLLAEFDFTIAQAVIWWNREWTGLCSPRFYADLANRRLHYNAPKRAEDAGGSILRVLKFLGRGYRISPEALGKVIARLCQGVYWAEIVSEEMLGNVLTGLMREVDPLLIADADGAPPTDWIDARISDSNDDESGAA